MSKRWDISGKLRRAKAEASQAVMAEMIAQEAEEYGRKTWEIHVQQVEVITHEGVVEITGQLNGYGPVVKVRLDQVAAIANDFKRSLQPGDIAEFPASVPLIYL